MCWTNPSIDTQNCFGRAIVLAMILILGGVHSASGKPQTASLILPVVGALEFTVSRNDEVIGHHRFDFRRNGNTLDVGIRARIAVEILFITVYRFEWDAHEIWRDGKLFQLSSKTHDDGIDHVVTASRNSSGRLDVVSNGKKSSMAGAMIPVSFWNDSIVRTAAHFNPIIGRPLRIAIAYKGEETISVRGKPTRAKHYSMTGELERELWYDSRSSLVRMTLIGKDGSLILYELK